MKLFQDSISPTGIRIWRGRHNGYTIYIKEIMNEELGYVDSYSYVIKNNHINYYSDSFKKGKMYHTVEECKNAAISSITESHMRVNLAK